METTTTAPSAADVFAALATIDHARVRAFELRAGDEIIHFEDGAYVLDRVLESSHRCDAPVPQAGEEYHRDTHRGLCWTIRTERTAWTCSPWNTTTYRVSTEQESAR